MKRNAVLLVAVCLVHWCSVPQARAQLDSGTIVGFVVDSSGAMVPEAKVVATLESSGVQTSASTDVSGLYRILNLRPGTYRVEVTKSGFKTYIAKGLEVSTAHTTRVDAALELGQLTQKVEVTGTAPLLNTTQSARTDLYQQTFVRDMPMSARSPLQLMVLVPGMVDTGGDRGAATAPGLAGGSTATQIYMDGGNTTNNAGENQGFSEIVPNAQFTQEFRILSSNTSAEYGGSGAPAILLTTKQGTNALHGNAYWFGQNDAFNSRDFFAASVPKMRQNVWGGTLGGPIKKDKAFFFGSYEGVRTTTGGPVNYQVPTLAEKQGDFSALGKTIYDPFSTVVAPDGTVTRTAFAGNIIPPDRWDPVAAQVLDYWPDPNFADAPNYRGNWSSIASRRSITGRVDYDINSENRIYGRIIDVRDFDNRFGAFPAALEVADTNRQVSTWPSFNILGSWVHTFASGRGVNEMVFDYGGRRLLVQGVGGGIDFVGQWGLPVPEVWDSPVPKLGDSPGQSSGQHRAFPFFSPENYSDIGHRLAMNQDPFRSHHFRDTFSFMSGTHAVKLGFEFRRAGASFYYARDVNGWYTFNSRPTAANPGDSASGDGFASFLLGWPSNGHLLDYKPRTPGIYQYATFIQDDWHIRRDLTLNLGLRYEFETALTDFKNNPPGVVGFDLTAMNPVSNTPGTVTFPENYYDATHTNFSPRIGIVWNPGQGKSVLRLGWGIYYQPAYMYPIWDLPGTSRPDVTKFININTPDNGVTAPFLLNEGLPAIPPFEISQLNPGFGAVPVGENPTMAPNFFERERPYPLIQQATVGFEHQLPHDVVVTGEYLLVNVRHANWQRYDINQVPPNLMGPGNAQIRRPFPQFSGLVSVSQPYGTAHYNGLTFRVDKKAGALTFTSNYTYMHWYDNSNPWVQNYYDHSTDWGPSAWGRRHQMAFGGVWETPLGKGRKFLTQGVAANILGGWNISSIFLVQSGSPFTITQAQDLTNAFLPGPPRPNMTGNPEGPRTREQWFNTDAFTVADPYTFGNEPANRVTGPGKWNIDASLIKVIKLGDRWEFELRGEFFNAFNHANWGNPDTTLGSPTFGQIWSTQGTASGTARIIQLGLKLSF